MREWPIHATDRWPDRDDRLRLDRPRNAAAHPAPFRMSTASRMVVIDPNDADCALCEEQGVRFVKEAVTRENYRDVPDAASDARAAAEASASTFRSIRRRSTSCASAARSGRSTSTPSSSLGPASISTARAGPEARTNNALRNTVREEKARSPGGATAISCCGANPGMVSWFVKQALINLAADLGHEFEEPGVDDREGWARLMRDLGVKGIHIAERDTQRSKNPKPMNVFVNTWSVDGFLSEGMQPAELGWGTHEKWLPENGRLETIGSRAGAYLLQPGANTRVRSWCPTPGAAVRLPGHPQRVDLDRRLLHAAGRRAASSTGRPATTPITRRTTRCCRCTSCSAAPGRRQDERSHPRRERDRRRHRRARRAALRPRARTPIGTARSFRSRRRASWRRTRTRPACR